MNKHASRPCAVYYVVTLQIWEYFSSYGMRVLLILYLTNQLRYSDSHAYELFSTYRLLVYVTPIFGGFLTDRALGNHTAVVLGAPLITIGHVVPGASEIHPSFLYLSLAIIICGYSLLKSNASCLLGKLYEPTGPCHDGGFSLMYVAGSARPTIAPITCGFAQGEHSWTMGFDLTTVGTIAGLVIFLYGNRHFTHIYSVNKKVLRMTNFLLPSWGWLLVLLAAMPALITVLSWKEWSVYVLIVTTIIGLGVLAKIHRKAENQKRRKESGLIVTLILFSMLFWAFVQQGNSSISFYIDRFVNRNMFGYVAPTAIFQSINAFTVMLYGAFLAWVIEESVAGNRTVHIWGKFVLDLGLMSTGFCILTLSARQSTTCDHSSLPLMVLNLAVMGFTELFIDPVAMSQTTRVEIPGVADVLTGIYTLSSGVIASHLTGVITDQASQASFNTSRAINYSTNAYIEVFDQIT